MFYMCKLSWGGCGIVQDIFRSRFSLEDDLTNLILSPKPLVFDELSIFRFDLRSTYIATIRPILTFMTLWTASGAPARVPVGRQRGHSGTTVATTSQEIFPSSKTPGVSRAGTKYPVRGIPDFHSLQGPNIPLGWIPHCSMSFPGIKYSLSISARSLEHIIGHGS